MLKSIESTDININKLAAVFASLAFWTAGLIGTAGFIRQTNNVIPFAVLLTVQLLAALNDIKSMTISAKITIPAFIAGGGIMLLTGKFLEGAAGACAAFVLLKLLMVISRNQIGGGDLAIMTVTGFYTGIGAFFSILFTSVVLAGIYSVAFILIGRVNKKTEIPFAPFILAATALLILLNYLC